MLDSQMRNEQRLRDERAKQERDRVEEDRVLKESKILAKQRRQAKGNPRKLR